MTQPADAVPAMTPASHAFFFDVDGTLAAIQSRPDEVFIPSEVLTHLQTLAGVSQGALALVSGRPLHELDALAAPLHLPMAGVHGAERRDAQGNMHRITLADAVVQPLEQTLTAALSAMTGTQLEAKGMAFALHFRNAPQYETAIMELAAAQVARFPQLQLQPGKCVVELKPKQSNKGAAVRAFMQESPFAGKIPVFVGDDLTDEAGFEVVNALGGMSIKVGEGQTMAACRLADVNAVHAWLKHLTLQLHQDATTSVRS